MKLLRRAASSGKPLLIGVAAVCGWLAPVAFAEPPAPPYVGVSYYPEGSGKHRHQHPPDTRAISPDRRTVAAAGGL